MVIYRWASWKWENHKGNNGIKKTYNENWQPELIANANDDLNLIITSIRENNLNGLIPQDGIDITYLLNGLNELVPET